ncbi:hypothetical protein GCM10007877_39140 [Marinibactrum halimedae]|uniref:Peptidase S8/S53 domain-containing protein n=2 Tax=Marinibactrum halimedae TaxID=1444977 RepID=A0AA37TDY6_9GAMM|nr:hypothetical protein GCM10007877_39140 [Marinibactrum halimedae]
MATVIGTQHNNAEFHGLAPKTHLLAIELTGSSISDILKTLNIAKQKKSDVINLSWELLFTSYPVRKAIDDIASNGRNGKGTIIVAAAGNTINEVPGLYRLASQPKVLAVNAVTVDGKIINKTQGDYIDISAPSFFNTFEVSNHGHFASNRVAGSSGATAVISGFATLLLSACPHLTRDAAFSYLLTSIRLAPKEKQQYLGVGVFSDRKFYENLHFCMKQ